VIVLVALSFIARSVSAQEPRQTLAVLGDVLKPRQWSVEDLRRQFAGEMRQIKFTPAADRQQQVGTGIPLTSLIQASAPRTEKFPNITI
jgi:hypothetical protein